MQIECVCYGSNIYMLFWDNQQIPLSLWGTKALHSKRCSFQRSGHSLHPLASLQHIVWCKHSASVVEDERKHRRFAGHGCLFAVVLYVLDLPVKLVPEVIFHLEHQFDTEFILYRVLYFPATALHSQSTSSYSLSCHLSSLRKDKALSSP